MIPKFTSPTVWQQAEILMQPTFIRVIDNIRKQLEASDWEGQYQHVNIWPDGTTPEEKVRVVQLQQELESAPPDELTTLQEALDQLPKPLPGYELQLTRNDNRITIDLWQLCYQICLSNYTHVQLDAVPAEIDIQLLGNSGNVDWHRLDEKAQECVGSIFARLPD
ncbi:MAG: hypothetical protein F6K09_10675 [Merismopedia sp. SIO2A8]|nr:hypothetical protein [Merismopedia sp. SIO2A8]